MTEAEWLSCRAMDSSIDSLLATVEPKASGRKARLFACAVARMYCPFLGDERSQRAIEFAERFADGTATGLELTAAKDAAKEAIQGATSRTAFWAADRYDWQAARVVVTASQEADFEIRSRSKSRQPCEIHGRHRSLIYCIFGNPFRPVTFNSDWLTSDVVAMARGMYEMRDFAAMPILADALQDAGCENADVLDHCRGQGPHVRGCWVVDLVLGKV